MKKIKMISDWDMFGQGIPTAKQLKAMKKWKPKQGLCQDAIMGKLFKKDIRGKMDLKINLKHTEPIERDCLCQCHCVDCPMRRELGKRVSCWHRGTCLHCTPVEEAKKEIVSVPDEENDAHYDDYHDLNDQPEPKCKCCSKDERTCVCTNDCIKSTKPEDHIPDVGEKVDSWEVRFYNKFSRTIENGKYLINNPDELKQFIQQELTKAHNKGFDRGAEAGKKLINFPAEQAKQQLREELIEKIEGEKVFEGFQWKGGINKKLLVKDKIYNKALSHIIDLIKSKI